MMMFVSAAVFPYKRVPITSCLIPIKLVPHVKVRCAL